MHIKNYLFFLLLLTGLPVLAQTSGSGHLVPKNNGHKEVYFDSLVFAGKEQIFVYRNGVRDTVYRLDYQAIDLDGPGNPRIEMSYDGKLYDKIEVREPTKNGKKYKKVKYYAPYDLPTHSSDTSKRISLNEMKQFCLCTEPLRWGIAIHPLTFIENGYRASLEVPVVSNVSVNLDFTWLRTAWIVKLGPDFTEHFLSRKRVDQGFTGRFGLRFYPNTQPRKDKSLTYFMPEFMYKRFTMPNSPDIFQRYAFHMKLGWVSSPFDRFYTDFYMGAGWRFYRDIEAVPDPFPPSKTDYISFQLGFAVGVRI